MARAVGFIEAEGFVPIFDAVDAMVKATEVDVRGVTRLGGGVPSLPHSAAAPARRPWRRVGHRTR